VTQYDKILFTGATAVNYEPPASTQIVLLANSLAGRSYEACSSIKMPDLFMLKRLWRPAVVQQHSFVITR